MTFNIDSAIFIGFLIINLGVGLFYSRGIKTIKEYAIGDRNFSTSTLTTTVIATYIGAGFITAALTESYRQGLYFIIPVLGEPLALVATGWFLVPKMKAFLGQTSVAEAMGILYGDLVKKITALCGIFIGVGIVALQIKVSFSLMQLFFGVSSFYASTISAIIIIMYSSLGGIKAVTFTDVLQFCTFGLIIPVICLSIWKASDISQVISTISDNNLFDFTQIVNPYNPRFTALICLFLYFVIPSIDPAYFQRISMAKNIIQAKKSFMIAGAVSLIMLLVVCWTSILLLSNNSNLDPNSLLTYILENYTYPGLKGVAAIGIMAAIMSTADSYLNSASILLAQNMFKQFEDNKKKLHVLRLVSISIGIISYILANKAESLFQILVMTMSLYMPIVSVPLLLAIFGIKSNKNVVLIGMGAGLVTVLSWSNLYNYAQLVGFNSEVIEQTNEAIPGMLANLIAFTIAHLIYSKPKNPTDSDNKIKYIKSKRSYINNFKNFNLFIFCNKNFSKHQYLYVLAGLYTFISVFLEGYLVKNISSSKIELFYFVYYTSLISSFILVIIPVAPFLSNNKITLLKFFLVPYILIFSPLILILLNNFEQMQVSIFLLSIFVLSCIIRLRAALILFFLTGLFTIYLYKFLIGSDIFDIQYVNITLKFKVIYILLITSTVFIAFLKPKQEYQELTEEKNEHLTDRISSQEKQLREALVLKEEFIRNISHEYHAPMTGITSIADVLWESYDKLNDNQRKAAVETILKSSRRLDVFDSNISALAALSKAGYVLKLKPVNLSELLEDRIALCRKLYEENKEDREFILNIEEGVVFDLDEDYMKQTLDNLIINAVTYCPKGKITVVLKTNVNEIICTIEDEGIGIPPNELEDIFAEFTVSSKTRTPAGGRGVGLALCKRVIELHRGKISAQSDGIIGSVFSIKLMKT